MSFYAVEWALGLDGLKPVTKAVLIALCRHENGGQCFPSINRLAKVSGYSRNTIITHLKTLEADGLITRVKKRMENASYDVSVTKINIPSPSVRPALPSTTDALPPSAEDGRGVAQALHLNTVTIISKNTVAEFEAFWSSWRPYDMEKGNKKPALEKYEKITRSGTDEFHHVSANPDNVLGQHLAQFLARDKVHIVAMTGSYFRGDAEPVLMPEDEAKFETVTYTYYEQLNGYQYLKRLDIGYYFYSAAYTDDILNVLNPDEKTIIHIPNVNARESTGDKIKEAEHIIHELGEWQGVDPATGFHLVKSKSTGKVLRIADLVDDDVKREKVLSSLRDPAQKDNRDYVDMIIALGMAKEGFDWIWCEHALTIGYRSSLTEIVQIIGRATRDAKGKTHARFTNLIAEPDAASELVTDAVNDTLKAIAASLLMEQVLAPRFNFVPKRADSGPAIGYEYGESGYDPFKPNVGFNPTTGQFQIEIKGLVEPKSEEASRICKEDLNEVIAAFVQDKTTLERGIFDPEVVPQELTEVRMGKIIKDKYPELSEEDQEAVRQHAIAALNITQEAKKAINAAPGAADSPNMALIAGVRKFALDVRNLDIDLIDQINPFSEAYAILAKAMDEENLRKIQAIIAGKRINLTPEEARDLSKRALQFKKERGRLPSLTASDPWEKRMAEGVAFLARMKAEAANG